MKSPAATHAWLKRVSEYQSGGVSDAERAAVEAHLATCQECQEALAMYRRFYSLLRSPLRLGPPSVHFDDDSAFNDATTRPVASANAPQSYPSNPSYESYPPSQPPRPPQRSRRSRALAGVAAVLAATIVIAGFLAVYASHGGRPATTTITPTPQATATTGAAATATPGADSTPQPQPGAFICANAPGSQLTYVYRRSDLKLYTVTGCDQPRALPLPAYSYPLAWSPSNRYLAVQTPPTDAQQTGPYPLAIYDTSNGQILTTKFDAGYPNEASVGTTLRMFIGWVDDNTFLGAVQPVVYGGDNNTGPLGVSTIVKVNVATQTETAVGKVLWFAGTKMVAPNYLFYAGLKNTGEGQAHLHRLNLNTGADTQLVPLGEYGHGGCQVTIFCNWTAWWDVSPDGAHVLYHNPAPTSFPSDTGPVKDTPLVYANVDGSNASKPFGDKLADTLTSANFSPNGSYFVVNGPPIGKPNNQPEIALVQLGQSVEVGSVDGRFDAWRGDSRAMVMEVGDVLKVSLYDIASHKTTALEADSMWYLWGN